MPKSRATSSRARCCSSRAGASSSISRHSATSTRPPARRCRPTPPSTSPRRPSRRRRPLLYQPGTVWDYGFGLDVLGQIVESLSEQSLGQYLQEHVQRPLGMVDTGFLIPADKAARYAKALPNDPDSGRPQSLRPLTQPVKFECGGGCAASTASDYMRFALMLLNKGTYNGTRIL